MTTTKSSITVHLTEDERITLLDFALEYSRDLKDSDPVEQTLGSALDKLANCLRLSSDW